MDDEEIRGLVRGQIPHPTRVTGQQQQQQQRRQALDHRDQNRLQRVLENLEESESLFQENNTSREYEEEETAETNRGNQRLNQSNHHFRNQERSRHSVRNSRLESLSTGAAAATQNNMSLALSDRHPGHAQSTASLLDSMERRTQRTYRYGIGLVCVGATLNWLGFAQVSPA